jgi:hypothetical protein
MESLDFSKFIYFPYFDLPGSIELYGFDIESFSENGWGYIKEILDEFITVRKFYIKRDYIDVAWSAYKLIQKYYKNKFIESPYLIVQISF